MRARGGGAAGAAGPDEEERIREAFATASRAGATLVLYLIGHGSSDFDDGLYHVIPADHPVSLMELPARGYPLGARLRALHGEFPGSVGVILVLDTCESGRHADERTWSMPMKRISVSTATSYEAGWKARFSRVVGEYLETGCADTWSAGTCPPTGSATSRGSRRATG